MKYASSPAQQVGKMTISGVVSFVKFRQDDDNSATVIGYTV